MKFKKKMPMMHMIKTDLKDATESRYRTYPHTHNNTDKYGKTVLTPPPLLLRKVVYDFA